MKNPITIHLTQSASASDHQKYVVLPFEVPAGYGRIEVSYQYNNRVGSDPHLTDGNTIDIGIFDPRGADFMGQGFRGWSGSARDSFILGGRDTTPGYLDGPIQPGTWHICLGLYKIAASGCQIEVRITLSAAADSPADFAPRLRQDSSHRAASPDGWLRGDMHCHSYHSDGDSSPEAVIRRAEELGLDFLALTDHNNVSHQADLAELVSKTDLLLIPGLEVTTYKGHWNIWGDSGWIDFRVHNADEMAQAVRSARERGFLVSCNHPRPYGPEWAYPEIADFDCIEAWNGPWELNNNTCLAYWDAQLRAGRRITAVGGSDNHFLNRPHIARLGHPTMWVYCPGDVTVPALLSAIRAGRVCLSDQPDGPRISLRVGAACMGDSIARPDQDQLRLVLDLQGCQGLDLEIHGSDGLLHAQPLRAADINENGEMALTLNLAGSHYLRAQIMDPTLRPQPVRALTNPIYFDDEN